MGVVVFLCVCALRCNYGILGDLRLELVLQFF